MSDTESTLKNHPATQLATEKIVQEAEPTGSTVSAISKIRLNNGSDKFRHSALAR